MSCISLAPASSSRRSHLTQILYRGRSGSPLIAAETGGSAPYHECCESQVHAGATGMCNEQGSEGPHASELPLLRRVSVSRAGTRAPTRGHGRRGYLQRGGGIQGRE